MDKMKIEEGRNKDTTSERVIHLKSDTYLGCKGARRALACSFRTNTIIWVKPNTPWFNLIRPSFHFQLHRMCELFAQLWVFSLIEIYLKWI